MHLYTEKSAIDVLQPAVSWMGTNLKEKNHLHLGKMWRPCACAIYTYADALYILASEKVDIWTTAYFQAFSVYTDFP